MEIEELIAAVKAANDKAELEALVKRELELDLDKRKSLDTLRAEVLKGLGVAEGDEPGAGDGDTPGAGTGAGGSEQQSDAGPDPVLIAGAGDSQDSLLIQTLRDENVELRQDNELLLSQLQAAQIQIQDLEAARQVGYGLSGGVTGDSLTPPDLDDVEQPEPVKLPAVRLLRNTENGRDFAWTPELAKLPNMKEL